MRHNKFLALCATILASAGALASPAVSEESKSLPDTTTQSGPANRDAGALSPATTVNGGGVDTFAKTRPRLVLALSGGAIKCVAEIGVLRSLEQHHIKIDGIVGTSMGATIGALYCAGHSVDEIEALFIDDTIQNAMLKGAILSVVERPVKPLVHIIEGKPYAGMTSGKGYYKLLEEKLPETFKELKIPFAAVVTNLTDGQTSVLTQGNLPKSVLASNCIPTLFRPILIDGKLYVDGGLKANLPSNIAESMGADVVVAVLVDTAVKPVPNKEFKSKKALILRVLNIMMASSDKMQARSSDVLIYPNADFLPVLTKDPEMLKKAIAAGQAAADTEADRIASQLLAAHKAPK